MPGMLTLCATPIGNLEDISMRALRALREADLIAAEDTRNSIRLLNHFDIHTPMTSYHEYNKYDKGRVLVRKMLDGENVVLITDAGTPGISDPGEELVRMAWDAGIVVTAVPGPAAVITALTISGMPTRRFAFEAFLPHDKKERRQVLEELQTETRTIVLYEAPHRLRKTLQELADFLGEERSREALAVPADLAGFSKKTFGMFGGEDTQVRLFGKNELVGVILDHFGSDILVVP
ncbi:MAG: 16S rRNA (cytidine(1402)-2'-O)-methyltransferase, partial [Lachnospiraceae bacterium]|nr:16S rRNA (cytidine(1402)-2'-O)-methyltransferase [Lachnospiraceae bacterium]